MKEGCLHCIKAKSAYRSKSLEKKKVIVQGADGLTSSFLADFTSGQPSYIEWLPSRG